jgi:hypothetical protein
MKIKSAFFILIQISIITILAFGIVNLFSFTQIKKEYSSLNFIPENASFVSRIDSKEIGKGILKDFISKDLFSQLPKTKREGDLIDLSFIDFNYPLYFFIQSANKNQIFVATFQLLNSDAFIESVNKPNQNSIGFTYNGKGFWIFNCPKNDIDSVKQLIISSKSTKWEKLLNSKNEIAFMSGFLDAKGFISIHENTLRINASLNTKLTDSKSLKKLKTDGFNLTVSNPLLILKNMSEDNPSLLANSLTGIKSISINHYGYRAPFFPNLTALLQVDSSFNFEKSIKRINSSQVEYENSKLYLGGAKFYVSKVQSDSYLLSYKENQTFVLQNSDNFIESNGDLTQLVNFDDAPLMKMFLLSNSTISKIYSIIQKTEKFNFTISQKENTNSGEINLTLSLKKKNSFYAEMLSFIM